MGIRSYLAILRRRKWIIIVTTLLCTLAAATLAYLTPPVYRSTSVLRVATVGADVVGGRSDISYTDRLMNTYSRIVVGPSTRTRIAEELNLSERPQISVDLIPNTELMRIVAGASDPAVARDAANAAAQILIERSRELYASTGQTTLDILQRQVEQTETELAQLQADYNVVLNEFGADTPEAAAAAQAISLKERTYTTLLDEYERVRMDETMRANAVSVVEPASLPTAPSEPRVLLNILLGFLVGLFVGVGLGLLRENLDTRLYTTNQIETVAKLPTIGRIPRTIGTIPAVNLNGNSYQPQVEAFRRLRINVLNLDRDAQPHSLLVTSAVEGEGKSTVCANLAVSLARSGRSVVLVDCDLHDPSQHTIFGLSNERGLTNILTKQAAAAGVVQKSNVANLYIITNGPGLPDFGPRTSMPSLTPAALAERLEQGTELLGSVQMQDLLSQLEHEFDIVLIDSPALMTVSDAVVLAPIIDHVLLVVARGQAGRDAVHAVRQQLNAVNVSSVSLVVNYAEG